MLYTFARQQKDNEPWERNRTNYVWMHVCTYYVCMYVCFLVCMYVCMNVCPTYVCKYACMYVWLCVHLHISSAAVLALRHWVRCLRLRCMHHESRREVLVQWNFPAHFASSTRRAMRCCRAPWLSTEQLRQSDCSFGMVDNHRRAMYKQHVGKCKARETHLTV